MPSRICLVLGGVRSGKSGFAERLVSELQLPTLYVATGVITDPEMEERVRRHQQSRPTEWETLEEPLLLAQRLGKRMADDERPGSVLIDSVDVWVANLLLEHEADPKHELEARALAASQELLGAMQAAEASYFLVSGEVGHSLVPTEPLGRRFQDLLGLVNQELAAAATEVFLVVAGIPTRIKPPIGNIGE